METRKFDGVGVGKSGFVVAIGASEEGALGETKKISLKDSMKKG